MSAEELLRLIKAGNTESVTSLLGREPELCSHCFVDGTTALHQAVMHNKPDIIRALIKAGSEINCFTQSPTQPTGVSPLMMAIWNGHLNSVNAIIEESQTQKRDIVLSSQTPGGHNVLTNAVERVNSNVNATQAVRGNAVAILERVLDLPGAHDMIDVKRKVAPQESAMDIAMRGGDTAVIDAMWGVKYPKRKISYSGWLKARRMVDNPGAFQEYQDTLKKGTEGKGVIKETVLSRKLESDVVSDMARANENDQGEDAVSQVVERLKKLGYEQNAEVVYDACVAYLESCPIVMTFPAKFLQEKGLHQYKALNIFETGGSTDTYIADRSQVEKELFKSLTTNTTRTHDQRYQSTQAEVKQTNIKTALIDSKSARPKYAKLELLDPAHPIRPINRYGKSYVVFKKVVNLNSLSLPANPYYYYHHNTPGNPSYTPAAHTAWDVFLNQCSDNKLKSIAQRVTQGHLDAAYDPENSGVDGYPVMLLPSVDLLDSNLVEHMHIDASEYVLTAQDKRVLQEEKGINLTKRGYNPYLDLQQELFEFIKQNDLKNVMTSLRKHPSLLMMLNSDGKTPIEVAEEKGCAQIVDFLFKEGARVSLFWKHSLLEAIEQKDNVQEVRRLLHEMEEKHSITHMMIQTAFERAVINGRVDLIVLLFKLGADPNQLDSASVSALHRAVQMENLPLVEELLKLPGIKLNIGTRKDSASYVEKETPLHVAAFGSESPSNRAILSLLIERGAHPGLKTAQGETPLMWAIREKKINHVVALIAAGRRSGVNEIDKEEWTALLKTAVASGDERIVELIRSIPDSSVVKDKAFHQAVKDKNLDSLQRWIALGVDPNVLDENKKTALHYAVEGNHFDMMRVLLDIPDIDINKPDGEGVTPLYSVSNQLTTDVLALLIRNKADLSPRPDGRTVLTNAAFFNQLENVQYLLTLPEVKEHCNSIVQPEGDTAFIYAVRHGTVAMIKVMAAIPEMDVNHKNSKGECALSIAIQARDVEKVKLLLEIKNIDFKPFFDELVSLAVDKLDIGLIRKCIIAGENVSQEKWESVAKAAEQKGDPVLAVLCRIKNMSDDEQSTSHQAIIIRLKEMAFSGECRDRDYYASVLTEYRYFEKLSILIKEISEFEILSNISNDPDIMEASRLLKTQANQIFSNCSNCEKAYKDIKKMADKLSALNELKKIVNLIKGDSENKNRQAAINTLKTKASLSYKKGAIEELKNEITGFIVLDQHAQKILEIEKSSFGKNEKNFKYISDIKEKINEAYESYAKGEEKVDESLLRNIRQLVTNYNATIRRASFFASRPDSKLRKQVANVLDDIEQSSAKQTVKK